MKRPKYTVICIRLTKENKYVPQRIIFAVNTTFKDTHINFAMDILSIGLFSGLSLCNDLNEDWVRGMLLTYFAIDSYKNKWDIVLHHGLYSIFTVMCPFEYVHKTLMLEWSTLFLLLYKKKYPTKELFAISWVLIRLIYCPYLCFTFNHDHYFINHLSIVVYYLHFHWSCKIINNKIDTTNGMSSMLLMLVPLQMLSYEVTLQTYITLYIQCQLSFYYRVFRTNMLHALDTSMIMYISLDYLNFYPFLSIVYFIYRQYYSIKFHKYVFLVSVTKLCYYNYELIPYVVIGVYSIKKNYIINWHLCGGKILEYCYKERIV